ncbi:hypothetical protein [Flavobacterium flavigenum]|uniref:hypothetical protein n=1 Tax=Flavobacterium flavigenum TaxID=3003258 RepID=UPI0022ABE84D|nr:hypothetical protein [Flavobacterium flavigenum]
MKIKFTFLILIILQLSCKNNTDKQEDTWNNRIQEFESQKEKTKKFDFEEFEILKGQVGDIKIGMNIKDAEEKLNELTKKEAEAYDFGFDGGGKAYIYSLENEPILALIPKRDSEEILVIIALSKNLKTNNDLNPKSKVTEIQAKYPNIEINQDLMMGWEFMSDKKNNWDFVFMTEENSRIGEYKEIEVPTKPKRTETKMDWITVK